MVQEKAEVPHFEMEKFFTPPKSFLPPFLASECSKLDIDNLEFSITSLGQKGGKKLLSGVKNMIFGHVLGM